MKAFRHIHLWTVRKRQLKGWKTKGISAHVERIMGGGLTQSSILATLKGEPLQKLVITSILTRGEEGC